MVADTLDNLARYIGLHPHLDLAIKALDGMDLHSLPDGPLDLHIEGVHGSLMTFDLGAGGLWEAHREHVDLQVVLGGEERIHWAPLGAIKGWSGHDPEKDILQSADSCPGSPLHLKRDMFAIFFPGDAHRPGIGQGQGRKAVIKIKAQAGPAAPGHPMRHLGSRTLREGRITLRPFRLDDAQAMFDNWCADHRVSDRLIWDRHPDVAFTRSLLKIWVAGYENPWQYKWGIEVDGQLVGDLSVVALNNHKQYCELGYCLAYDLWNQGIMTQALKMALRYLFLEVGFERIALKHLLDNPASGRVMQKAGLQLEGVLRRSERHKHGRLEDVALYAALRADWLAAHPG